MKQNLYDKIQRANLCINHKNDAQLIKYFSETWLKLFCTLPININRNYLTYCLNRFLKIFK